jgi:hypothetical protein
MNRHDESPPARSRGLVYGLLERCAAGLLLLVLAVLGWMIAVAYIPGTVRMASVELEVIAAIGLLLAALFLVSIVALMHTRK